MYKVYLLAFLVLSIFSTFLSLLSQILQIGRQLLRDVVAFTVVSQSSCRRGVESMPHFETGPKPGVRTPLTCSYYSRCFAHLHDVLRPVYCIALSVPPYPTNISSSCDFLLSLQNLYEHFTK